MRKKAILTFLLVIFLIAVIYLGFIKKGFIYFTGISTPYSYFQAGIAKNNKNLIFYDQNLPSCLASFNLDSLQKCYGFSREFGGWEVSTLVMKLYNSVIYDELIRRIGEKKWNEYQWKVDSLSNIGLEKFNYQLNTDNPETRKEFE
jgi:hypothetical protein